MSGFFYNTIIRDAKYVIKTHEAHSENLALIDVEPTSENVLIDKEIDPDITEERVIKSALTVAKSIQDDNTKVVTNHIKKELEQYEDDKEFMENLADELRFNDEEIREEGFIKYIVQAANVIYKTFSDFLKSTINKVWDELNTLFDWIVEQMLKGLDFLLENITKPIIMLLQILRNQLSVIWNVIGGLMMTACSQLMEWFLEGFDVATDGLADVLQGIFVALYDNFKIFVDAFNDMFPLIKKFFDMMVCFLQPEFWLCLLENSVLILIGVLISVISLTMIYLAVFPAVVNVPIPSVFNVLSSVPIIGQYLNAEEAERKFRVKLMVDEAVLKELGTQKIEDYVAREVERINKELDEAKK